MFYDLRPLVCELVANDLHVRCTVPFLGISVNVLLVHVLNLSVLNVL